MLRSFLLIFSLLFATKSFSWWMWTPGDTVDDSTQLWVVSGYEPEQPIPFSHKLHSSYDISCHYCHNGARRSSSAVIPPLNTCMGCHSIVHKDKEHIKYITEKYNKNEPMEWVKVHDLPDHVRFSHKVHVNAKGPDGKNLVECSSCHGPVETMEKVGQWAPLQMGWCIDCHNKVKIPAVGGKPAVKYASVACQTCHY